MPRTNTEWVAQVSLLRPGFSGQNPFARRNPGLKSETWATHSKSVKACQSLEVTA
jgi:hypothetical protein